MGRIRKLDAHLVNQIAAGEVVERPSSVVKELLENAIDAEASELVVSLEDGGKKLIRIQDNGCGMSADDLALCIQSHATSKIQCGDDLNRIMTLGFRGEALPSIGSVSEMTLTSRCADSDEAATIRVNGGEIGAVAPAGGAVGTTIEVRNLFFNVPARRKFLKTDATELGHVLDVVACVAMAYPQVAMRVEHNGRQVHNLPASQTVRSRIAAFFGQALADQLIEVDCDSPVGRLWGLVAPPSESRSTAKMQYLFLNGRYIRDKSLLHAVRESYRGLLEVNRQPIVFLYLEVAPDSIDVNVHPTKIEVRLRNGQQLYRELLVALRGRFLSSDLTPRIGSGASGHDFASAEGLSADAAEAVRQRARQSLADFLRSPGSGPAAVQHNFDYRRGAAGGGERAGDDGGRGRAMNSHLIGGGYGGGEDGGRGYDCPALQSSGDGRDGDGGAIGAQAAMVGEQDAGGALSAGNQPESPVSGAAMATPTGRIIQLHNTYLVAETDEGMLIVDQHALHERVLYEELRERIMRGPLEAQRLLLAAVMDVTPRELAYLEEHRAMLAGLGIDFERFGSSSIGIQSFPSLICRRLQPERVLRDLLEWAANQESGSSGGEQALDELLHRMACHAAVKAGDRLLPEEMEALLERRNLAELAATCPHGRPTSLILPKDELERQFKRDYRSVKPPGDDGIPF